MTDDPYNVLAIPWEEVEHFYFLCQELGVASRADVRDAFEDTQYEDRHWMAAEQQIVAAWLDRSLIPEAANYLAAAETLAAYGVGRLPGTGIIEANEYIRGLGIRKVDPAKKVVHFLNRAGLATRMADGLPPGAAKVRPLEPVVQSGDKAVADMIRSLREAGVTNVAILEALAALR